MSSVAERMLEDANEAMKLTRKFFVVELDFSEASLQQLEGVLDDVEFALRGGRSPENIERLTRVWGSYLGEVMRRQLGGQWIEQADHQVALQCGGATLSPHDQMHRRLTQGAAHNVWLYYHQAARR